MDNRKTRQMNISEKLAPWIGFIIAVPFFAGACVLGWQESHLPRELRILAGPLIMQARLFAIGFSLSLFASVMALTTRSTHKRIASTGLIIAGIAIITSGFTTYRFIEQSLWSIKPALWSFMIPGILYMYSLWLLITAIKIKKVQNEAIQIQAPIEEQPQPLSRP